MKPRPDITTAPRPGCGSVRADEVCDATRVRRRLNLAFRALADAQRQGLRPCFRAGQVCSWQRCPGMVPRAFRATSRQRRAGR